MKEEILKVEKPLKKGHILERVNRFLLKVRFDEGEENVYLANSGELSTVLKKGRPVLCKEAFNKKGRKTDFDAFAVKVGEIFVTVDSIFANELFSNILTKGVIDDFSKYSLISEEPTLPGGSRADFLLKNEETQRDSIIEIKSCTHVEEGVAKFPDRPTERGRKHLKILKDLHGENRNKVIFIVQRPDAKKFKPYENVDPDFKNILEKVRDEGLDIRAISTDFRPPYLYLSNESLPIEL